MSAPKPYCSLEAFIEPDQTDWTADGVRRQLITVRMTDETCELSPAFSAFTAEQTRVSRSSCCAWQSTPSG